MGTMFTVGDLAFTGLGGDGTLAYEGYRALLFWR